MDTYGTDFESLAKVAADGRLIEVRYADDGGPTLHIDSEGLVLADKLSIERRIKGTLASEGHVAHVYFRRRESPATSSPPRPVSERRAPFGLKIDKRAIPGVHDVVVVASGKGGVGKSTVATNLAVSLAESGARVGLLDADIYGPSAPLMMGLKGPLPVEAGGLVSPLTAHGVKTVSFGFLTDTREPVIWRGPLVAKALKQLCYDVAWGDLDHLIIDLPPGTGDVQLALIESIPIHGAIIVTTPQDVALLDAHKAVSMFETLSVPIVGVVENMAYFACPCCGEKVDVFGDGGGARLASERKTRLLARIPLNAAVRRQGDLGSPVALSPSEALSGPFRELAKEIRTPRSLH